MSKYQEMIKLCLVCFSLMFFQNTVMAEYNDMGSITNVGYLYIETGDDGFERAMLDKLSPINSSIVISKNTKIFELEELNKIKQSFYSLENKKDCAFLELKHGFTKYMANEEVKCGILSAEIGKVIKEKTNAIIISYHKQDGLLFALVYISDTDITSAYYAERKQLKKQFKINN